MIETWGAALAGGGLAVLVYTYVGYPLGLAIVAQLVSRRSQAKPSSGSGAKIGSGAKDSALLEKPSIAVVMAVRNGESDLPRRLGELTEMLGRQHPTSEIIVVSDGSTDATAKIATSFADQGVRLIEHSTNLGKAVSLNRAVASTQCPIVVLADVRQRWSPGTIDAMLMSLADPDVGGVSGELVLEESPGVLAGVGAYWRYEKWIRKTESRIGSQIGVTGAIAAVRRECFRDIPPGTILDDVYWPMQVVLQGRRVVFNSNAKAYDRLPDQTSGEFRRKVRTLAGNFQLVALCPRLLVPGINPAWIQFFSHKLCRLVCPWAMIAMVVGCVLAGSLVYQIGLLAMLGMIGLGIAGLTTSLGTTSRVASAAGSFLLLNAAAWVGFWSWASGRSDRLWSRSAYQGAEPESSIVVPNTHNQARSSDHTTSQDSTGCAETATSGDSG